jgi:hypothetical protein
VAVRRGHNVKYKRAAWKKSKNRKGCIFFGRERERLNVQRNLEAR